MDNATDKSHGENDEELYMQPENNLLLRALISQ